MRFHSAKFSGHTYCGCDGVMLLVCHVNLQDHVIKRLCDIISSFP